MRGSASSARANERCWRCPTERLTPRSLILDEATSSIDTQTEKVIQEALRRLLQGRTSFVIAHRLSTIKEADKVVVMHQGRIVEMGTHDELLARRGYYYGLYSMQWRSSEQAAD